MAIRSLKIARAVLVYQAGIANVFHVDRQTDFPENRNARRLYQGDFRSAEMIAYGLKLAGTNVTTMGCNMAGDIINAQWTSDLDSLPFSDKFHLVGNL